MHPKPCQQRRHLLPQIVEDAFPEFTRSLCDMIVLCCKNAIKDDLPEDDYLLTKCSSLFFFILKSKCTSIFTRKALLSALEHESSLINEEVNENNEKLLRGIASHAETLHTLLSSAFGGSHGGGPENDALIQYILLKLSNSFANTQDPTYLLPLSPIIPLLQTYEELNRNNSTMNTQLIEPSLELTLAVAESMELPITRQLSSTITVSVPILLLHKVRPLFHTRSEVRLACIKKLRSEEDRYYHL